MSLTLTITPPPPIRDYATLITTVAAYLDRSNLNERIPTFIQLAEDDFNDMIRAPEMENTAVFDIDGEYPIPDDLLEIRNITLTTDPDASIEQVTPARMVALQRQVGRPTNYAQVGMALRFGPTPEARVAPYEAVIEYYQKINPLSVYIPTNWLLLRRSSLYLFGALTQAEAYLNNDERVPLWKSAFEEALQRLTDAVKRKKYGPTPLVMRSCVRQTCGRARI